MIHLDDHRRFGAVVTVVIAAAALLIAGLLLVAGREGAVPGLAAGAVIAAIDAWLLARSLTRFNQRSAELGGSGSRALTMLMMTRFLSVSAMVGVVICAKGMDPIGVIVGILLFPMAIVVVGLAALRAGAGSAGEATRAAG